MIVTERKNNGASSPSVLITNRRRGPGIILAILSILFLLGTIGAQPAQAGTTTLTFDEFSSGTALTTQYQSLGVTVDGATIFSSCSTCTFPPVSGSNLAAAPSGSMRFSFDSKVIGGNVQTVSAYVTDYFGAAGIYAYDSSGNLLGQSLLPVTGGVSTLLSVTSPANPIAYVLIHDGGGQIGIDNLSFTWIPVEFSVLHSFDGTEGGGPWGGVILDSSGNLYGTTNSGGSVSSLGTVFKLDTSGRLAVLHKFSGTNGDGTTPLAGLLMDSSGNLYGTTYQGGDLSGCGGKGCGTVFKLDPFGELTVLHSFKGMEGSEGAYPRAELTMDTAGYLYGTTSGGVYGSVFKLDTSGSNFSVLHTFTHSGPNFPYAGLIMDASGSLYGTASSGGSGCSPRGCGAVFKLDASGGNFSVLHAFVDSDPHFPYGDLVMDSSGNLYGTTYQGGDLSGCGGKGCGTVFKLDPFGELTVLHSFSGADGAYPWEGLVMDPSGNLYGATGGGGLYNACTGGCGTVFKLDTSGGNFSVLHSFNWSDGAYPYGGRVLIDAAGTLYGTTYLGGDAGDGTVFKVVTTGSSQQALSNMVNYVGTLYSQAVLNSGQVNSLVTKLQHAIRMIDTGKINGAIGNLKGFLGEVNGLGNSRRLTSAQASALTNAAHGVIAQLR